MKDPQTCRELTERSIAQLFLPHSDADRQEYAAFGLTQVEFDAVRRPRATGWRHFMRLRGLGSVQGEFDLKCAAELLTKLAWIPRDFTELLEGIRAEVGEDPAVSLPVPYRRLLGHLSQRK